jgi:hypothetical protein
MLFLVSRELFKNNNLNIFGKYLSGRIAIYTIVYQITGSVGMLSKFILKLVRIIQIFQPKFFLEWLHLIHMFVVLSNSFQFSIAFIYCEDLYTFYNLKFCSKKNHNNEIIDLNSNNSYLMINQNPESISLIQNSQ